VQPSLNRVTLVGTLGRDPELRFTASGDPVAVFSVLTSRDWVTTGGEERRAVEWFNVIAWHQLAETCARTLREGSRVYVEGRMQARTWPDEGGRVQERAEVVAADIVALDDLLSNPPGEAPAPERTDTPRRAELPEEPDTPTLG